MTRLFSPFGFALLAATVVAVITGFVLLPAGTTLPVHWGISGEADGFMPREWALLMPLMLLLLVWGIFLAIARFSSAQQIEAGRSVTRSTLTALGGLFLFMEIAIVLIGVGVAINMVQGVSVAIGVLLVVLGNVMPKSRPNGFAGLRIPSTLNDAANWQATHRLTGLLCIVGGLVLIAAAMLVPTPHLFGWLIGCVLVPIAVGTIYSLNLARRPKA